MFGCHITLYVFFLMCLVGHFLGGGGGCGNSFFFNFFFGGNWGVLVHSYCPITRQSVTSHLSSHAT